MMIKSRLYCTYLVRNQMGCGQSLYLSFVCMAIKTMFIWSWFQLMFLLLHLLRYCNDLWQFVVPDFTEIMAPTLGVLSENCDRCSELRRSFMKDVAASWTKGELTGFLFLLQLLTLEDYGKLELSQLSIIFVISLEIKY